jgi:hypothetical protein
MATTTPTLGVNVETVSFKNIEFMVMDMGGQDKIRALWSHYYEGGDAIIFVVDSADDERLAEVSAIASAHSHPRTSPAPAIRRKRQAPIGIIALGYACHWFGFDAVCGRGGATGSGVLTSTPPRLPRRRATSCTS